MTLSLTLRHAYPEELAEKNLHLSTMILDDGQANMLFCRYFFPEGADKEGFLTGIRLIYDGDGVVSMTAQSSSG